MAKKKNNFKKILIIVGIISIISIAYACLALTNIIQMISIGEVKNLDEKEYEISQSKEQEESNQEQGNEVQKDAIETQNIENDINMQSEEEKIIECESIMQGVKDLNLENGYYTLRVTGQVNGVEETIDYEIELWNFYADTHDKKNTQI